jgi:serine/threonine protein kinase
MAESDELSTVDAEMAAPPSSDPIALELARARIELAMFGVMKPPRLGRYEILDPLAGGGMGLVYAAYDPELQRRVALKVVYPGGGADPRARERLMREARALARLDHPNVVRVHDVLSHEGQIVVVMALLEGQTLATWERASPRHWREVVATYLQAGEGLAAAHSVEVIHRDFKPGNAIIGPDGHVRVLDFGLARMSDGLDGETVDANAPYKPLASPLRTATGAFVGTFLYASPEQLAGSTITAASDQFSFCVAMHRAVEGIAPFEGASIEDRLVSIRRGEPHVAGDRRVPAWLRDALRRGLASAPLHRHGSMRELLDELGRPRGLRRWRWPVVTAALALALAVLGFTQTRADVCSNSPVLAARVWGSPEHFSLASKFAALPVPYAVDIERRVFDALDKHASDWSSTRQNVCLAHLHNEQSDALFDTKMLCLDRELRTLSSSLDVLLRLDRDHVANATDVARGLVPPHLCDDSERLARLPVAPSSTDTIVEAERIRALVEYATLLDRASSSDAALESARSAMNAAEKIGYAPVVAEAGLALGRILISRSNATAAVAPLRAALDAALTSRSEPRIAVEAGARLIWVEGAIEPDLHRVEDDLAFLEPMSRVPPVDHFSRALLYNNVGEVYRFASHRDQAKSYFERARAAAEGETDVELTIIDRNLALVVDDPVAQEQLVRGAWERLRRVLGPHHLRVLQAQGDLADMQQDPADAARLMAPVCADYGDGRSDTTALLIECNDLLGYYAAESGNLELATLAYRTAIRAATSPDDEEYRFLAIADLARFTGDSMTASSGYRKVVAALESRKDWWERRPAIQAHFGLGQIALASDDVRAAFVELSAAVRGYDELQRVRPGLMNRRRLETATRQLASLPKTPERNPATPH